MNKKSLDNVLSEVVKVFGPYSEKVVIGGGIALLIYRYYLSSESKLIKPAITKDLDLLIPRNLKMEGSLSNRLLEYGFKRTTSSLETPPVESYAANIKGEEVVLEFLTDRRSRENRNSNVIVGGISAQPLSYIEMSLENPIGFAIGKNLFTQVVSPDRWLFHKALTFPKRRSKAKLSKDLYGIWYVGSQLGKLSEKTLVDLLILKEKSPKAWSNKFKKQIQNWIANASPSDWKTLEAQDPAQKLSKLSFIEFVESQLEIKI
jgi:hypothetical protein